MAQSTESEVSSPLSNPQAFCPGNRRKVLLVFPKFAYSFGTFNHAFPLMNVKGFMPPQGILLMAALLPKEWETRFVDENIRTATEEDFAWADVVFTSGMHIQRDRIRDIIVRAHKAGKAAALGGPSVSSAPDFYPEADFLHIGEAGDSTVKLFEHLDKDVTRPDKPMRFVTVDRMPLTDFPSPAYHMIDAMDYLLGSVQFSSGCPFTCEFCDIPSLYGRNPRLKTPDQIISELDALADQGVVSVYFVDDNFIGNPKAAKELLPRLIEWQKKRDFQVRLSCENTLNIARYPELLQQMKEAFFTNMFIGIETPETDALDAMKKRQNLRAPIQEAIEKINSYGIEVASGIIMGLDTDTPKTPENLIRFAELSGIPIMTVNILYALPNTPLYKRLEEAKRILPEEACENRDSNIEFLEPYEEVVAKWRRVIGHIYSPETLYDRYEYNAIHTYPHRLGPTKPWKQATWFNIKRGAAIFARIIWRVGVRSDYKWLFWKMAIRKLATGKVEDMFQISMVAHHLITYARECVAGELQASNYSIRDVAKEDNTKEEERLAS